MPEDSRPPNDTTSSQLGRRIRNPGRGPRRQTVKQVQSNQALHTADENTAKSDKSVAIAEGRGHRGEPERNEAGPSKAKEPTLVLGGSRTTKEKISAPYGYEREEYDYERQAYDYEREEFDFECGKIAEAREKEEERGLRLRRL